MDEVSNEKPSRTAKPSREAKVVPFITPEVVEEVERSWTVEQQAEAGLFDGLEEEAVEAFVLTPELVVSCWGDAEALLNLAKAAGVETGRTKSASGLGGLLMAALQ